MGVLTAALCFLFTLTLVAPCRYRGYNCPGYEVLKKTNEFEIRKYKSYKYAQAGGEETSFNWAANNNFMKLFIYIQGGNKERKRIPMTVPVICPIKKTATGEYVQNFSMLFWLDEKFQCEGCAPEPNQAKHSKNQIKIVQWEERIAYVRTYSWYATEYWVRHHERELKKSLDAAGIKEGLDYDPLMVYSASYNQPFDILLRRNEVMFMQKQNV